jgi:crotonobetainyl-CoA:carnitine CoA-transferase CaiB-like acyl-CoA transferase
MLDVQVSFLANQAMNYLVSGKPPRRSGNAHPNIQPQDVFRCRDGHIVVVVGNDGQFEKFCGAVAYPDLLADERFKTNAGRVRNRETLKAIIEQILGQRDMADWMRRIEDAGVPCAPINTIPMALEDHQVKHREMLRQLPHAAAGTVPQIVSPMRFANAPLAFEHGPPVLGQHTEEILRELGLEAP